MPKSVIWIPLLLVGAMVYWTLALGFGGLSLMTVTLFQDDGADEAEGPASLKDSYQPITVNFVGADDVDHSLAQGPGQVNPQGAVGQNGEQAGQIEGVPLHVDLVPDHEGHDSFVGESGQGLRGGARRADPGPGDTAF